MKLNKIRYITTSLTAPFFYDQYLCLELGEECIQREYINIYSLDVNIYSLDGEFIRSGSRKTFIYHYGNETIAQFNIGTDRLVKSWPFSAKWASDDHLDKVMVWNGSIICQWRTYGLILLTGLGKIIDIYRGSAELVSLIDDDIYYVSRGKSSKHILYRHNLPSREYKRLRDLRDECPYYWNILVVKFNTKIYFIDGRQHIETTRRGVLNYKLAGENVRSLDGTTFIKMRNIIQLVPTSDYLLVVTKTQIHQYSKTGTLLDSLDRTGLLSYINNTVYWTHNNQLSSIRFDRRSYSLLDRTTKEKLFLLRAICKKYLCPDLLKIVYGYYHSLDR